MVTHDRRVKPDMAKLMETQLANEKRKVHLLRATLANALGLLERGAVNDNFMRAALIVLEETEQ